MRWLMLGLFVASAACFLAGWRVERTAASADDGIAAVIPYGLGAVLLVADVVLLVIYALWRLFA